jgi:hypothetical protein
MNARRRYQLRGERQAVCSGSIRLRLGRLLEYRRRVGYRRHLLVVEFSDRHPGREAGGEKCRERPLEGYERPGPPQIRNGSKEMTWLAISAWYITSMISERKVC